MTRTDPFYMSTYSCCLFTRSIAQSIGTWSGRPGLVPGPHSATSACVRDLRSKRTRLIISIALRTNMLRQPRCKRIHKLAETVADQVRSAQVVPTPAQALEEVVANSVDAKATRIDIEIDSVSFNIRVTDNGCGIPQSCFPSLALRHATSKHLAKSCDHSSHTLGFKGEALASIAENSVLHISSKAAGTFETHEKLLRGGKLVKQGLTADQRQSTGTVVWMQDFLYNQPVRRRQLEQSGYVASVLLAKHSQLPQQHESAGYRKS